MVYPGAVHSRFEHSLGVYWLPSDAVHRLKTCQAIELMVVDALIKANDHLQIASYINEPAQYWMDYDSFEKSHIKVDRVSHLLPACYQDMIVRVYTRKPELFNKDKGLSRHNLAVNSQTRKTVALIMQCMLTYDIEAKMRKMCKSV
ncbi:hypothetical protein RND71_023156 [Anisodus tanguticus]|uniref:Uncharacterized protein n=1 Tax=Anisodus tanguticus TaxID=243964 RepID=A0AAE1RV18_9SOLA|nr:hypothetical protein RND71_023156 [Anisodus tanguticus]